MKNKQIVPFTHENLDIKNSLLQLARDLSIKDDFQSQIASSFLYSSLTEYLAEHLLVNLRYFMYIGCYIQYAGILFIDEREEKKKRTLGQITGELGKYNFPDKQEIIILFQQVSQSRNNIFHNLAKSDEKGLEKIVKEDITSIKVKTEDLVAKINTIYAGLQKILIPTPEPTKTS